MERAFLSLVVLILADIAINLHFWRKASVNKAEFDLLLEITKKRAESIEPQKIDFQESKTKKSVREILEEIADDMDVLIADPKRDVLIRISNCPNGQFKIETKFGSS